MRKFVLLGVALTGCAAPPKQYDMQRTEATVRIHIVERIPDRSNLYGLSACRDGVCEIWIRRSVYPKCLVHEVRHAFEGNWHEGRNSLEDCI